MNGWDFYMDEKNEEFVWVYRRDLQRLVKISKKVAAHIVEGVETGKPLVDAGEERVD